MGLIEDLGEGPVGLDTSPLIYFVEEHPRYVALLDPLFERLQAGSIEAVTSGISLLEALVVPYRSGRTDLAERYEALLTRSRGLRLLPLERPLLRSAAHLRARASLKTPDALQLAAALSARCTAYLTNDRALPPGLGLRVLLLDDYLAPPPRHRPRRRG